MVGQESTTTGTHQMPCTEATSHTISPGLTEWPGVWCEMCLGHQDVDTRPGTVRVSILVHAMEDPMVAPEVEYWYASGGSHHRLLPVLRPRGAPRIYPWHVRCGYIR